MTSHTMNEQQSATAQPGDYAGITGAGTLRFERRLPGPIERVWAYLTEPDKLGKWLATGSFKQLKVGETAELVWDHSKLSAQKEPTPEKYASFQNTVTRWRITRLEAPRALSFIWDEGTPDASEVAIELKPSGNDVLLVLTHLRVNNTTDTAGGWHVHLDILSDNLAGREPRPFWSRHKQLEAEYQRRLADPASRR